MAPNALVPGPSSSSSSSSTTTTNGQASAATSTNMPSKTKATSTTKATKAKKMILVYENEDVASIPRLLKNGYRTRFVLYVNGELVPQSRAVLARPNQSLLGYLRTALGLTGSKLGCGEGGCGACTVLVSRRAATATAERQIVHGTVNACLFPVLACDGCHVTTVEGIGSWKRDRGDGDDLHPIQRAMVDMHGSQCGYCTPGIVAALYGIFADGGAGGGGDEGGGGPSVSLLEEHLDGNLCRCTGYRPIWDAARSLCADGGTTAELESERGPRGPCGTPCRECPERDSCEAECNAEDGAGNREGEWSDDNGGGCGGGGKNSICVSSTADKARDYAAAAGLQKEWWKQPDEMFPRALLPPESSSSSRDDDDGDDGDDDEEEVRRLLSHPLVVADASIHEGGTWFSPPSLEGLLDLLREHGDCKIVVGNTEVGIETKFKHAVYPRLVHPHPQSIPSLYDIFAGSDHLHIGACASLSALQRKCHDSTTTTTDDDAAVRLRRTTKPIHDMLRWFASTQIRNAACLGGNLATASPISDMNPLLACLGAQLVLASRPRSDGGIARRTVSVEDFFLSYRKVDLKPIELIERIDVPLIKSTFEYTAPFKQARRREDDISIVTSGMRVGLSPGINNWTIDSISIAFGGMAPTTVVARKTVAAMVGKPFLASTFEGARAVLRQEFCMPDDVPGGQAQYRLALACGFLHKFYLQCASELARDVEEARAGSDLPPAPTIDEVERSGANNGFVSRTKPRICGVQRFPSPKVAIGAEAVMFEEKKNDTVPLAAVAAKAKAAASKQNTADDAVGQPATHASAPLHCTGEAIYAGDIPAAENLLHGSLILASRCHLKFVSINVAPALCVPGVFGAYTAEDISKLGGDNRMGPILLDETAFLPTGETVQFVGQVLGIVVGASLEIAEKGARAVVVGYGEEEEGKCIVSIADAIEARSFWNDFRHEIRRGGDLDAVFGGKERTDDDEAKRHVIVEGSFRSGGQEHFYLEPNSTLAIPSEANLTIYASTQAPTKTQNFCASVTNTPAAKVVVRVKRMGGGFGGKETRSVFVSVAAAVAAKISNRPVRLTLNRDTDMSITGGRHTFLAYYKAAAIVDGNGVPKLHALDIKLYNNGGCAMDLSGPVMDRALFHVDGCYLWPNFRCVGVPCKTSQPPHTAFRGFGGPQGMAICEHVIEHLAIKCKVSADELRRENLYKLNESTPFGMRFGAKSGKWNVPGMWDRLYAEMDVPARREAAAEFNKKNKHIKRGTALIPVKFGIAFTAKFMNQGGALVHVYTDGTVLVSHGGTEMGQGLHTKVCQVAAQAFGIPLDHVYIDDTSTDKVANTNPSAASMSTDLYGMATLDACKQILKRIQSIKENMPPNSKLGDIAKAAFFERIDLSAHGFYAVDDDRCGYDWDKGASADYPSDMPENSWKGHPFNYFTQGVAFAEVEIDVLTGDHKTIIADVIVDVGSSINPAIDIGQIEGAFIQGMGWSTIEEVVLADNDHTWIRPRAKVFTTGPGTYKIPAFNDVPETFNVSLLEDVDNPFAVHSSKAIGEPPFFLGCSVFYAIKDAATSAREKYKNEYFEFRMPATSERIRMACTDAIAMECVIDEDGNKANIHNFQPKGSF